MKRDDQTGLAFGGNKIRKLEFLIGEALAQGCDTIITGGAEQSNHCRQTAAAAAACGLKCHLVLGGRAPAVPEGNLLLDQLFGAEIHWTGDLRKGEKIPEIAGELSADGGRPYIVPYGGSNATGATGFMEAVGELSIQLKERGCSITHVLFASSSGGTQAGLVLGKQVFTQDFELIGIGVDKEEMEEGSFRERTLKLAVSTAERLGVACDLGLKDIEVREEYVGDGYGIVGDPEREAIRITAESEGILLDPVYTGRAMAGLINMIQSGKFKQDDNVLFWHTGGAPALFSYAEDLMQGFIEPR
jgi:D-cysteine desulfhydrase